MSTQPTPKKTMSGSRKAAIAVAVAMMCVVTSVAHGAPPRARSQLVPSPGKHPYFSKHRAQWTKLVKLLRATRQLVPIRPRRFSYKTPAWDVRTRRYRLSQHKGEVILLTRWATWCKSCKYDLVAKRKLARKIKGLTVTILGVTHEPFPVVAKYHKTAPKAKIFPYGVVDRRGRFARFLPGTAYPATSVIDPWGWIIAKKVGPGLWITPPYFRLFGFLKQLAPVAWKQVFRQTTTRSSHSTP